MMLFNMVIRPFLARLDPETAHRLTIRALKCGFGPTVRVADDPRLNIRVWGMDFPNPVGLAAGFDKNAEVFGPMGRIGLGFVEVGSVTPLAQPGNPRPRLFRLPSDRAVINRMGFNNEGADAARANLAQRASKTDRGAASGAIVGVNLGKNKTSEDAASDYSIGTAALSEFADYLVVNVSSPNTPGLRALQSTDELLRIVEAVKTAKRPGPKGVLPPVLVKVAPDLTDEDVADLSVFALSGRESGLVDGLIVSNTTIARPADLKDNAVAEETGGLSGRPLFERSTEVLRDFYRRTEGQVPLIGVGGVSSGADAYAKIRAGASLVQLYTALAYDGPDLVAAIKRDLLARMLADGFTRIGSAVGADHK
ncbi:quinone-dependent dihydroorotate dehydrogenase [Hwanghaeella grinnelliae]|uniref:Dihydroorotate dehydrogenase (quinone) n=1 Tax=Hwanghaeella grinnelliae TaxID=2500179 RepID=A0A3S2Z827_9PROT|nr:quinone-dependent dihydroorotate dehydrogenase [Hwanghaeella grinnelliae]RVU35891.1 quinone-dependent dihydroorotate dehydrogenase [Hwanghaeella grinnelliae]